MPFTGFAAFALGARRSPMVLLLTLFVVPPETRMPLTVLDALVPSRLHTLLRSNVTVVPPETSMPVTADAPDEVRPVTVLLVHVCVPEVDSMPVIAPPPVKLLTVLPEIVAEPLKLTARPVMAFVPPTQLLKVLPVMFFTGDPPSVLRQPVMVVAPVRVMFEKLLPTLFSVMVGPDVEFEV